MANSTADTPNVSETKLARMRIKDLREHARERRIKGADDLHKPELLALVKDWHYVQEHGEHRPDAAGRAGRAAGIGTKKADVKKADVKKADVKKADVKKAEVKKAEVKKAEAKKAEAKKDVKKADGRKKDARSGTAAGSRKTSSGGKKDADVRRAVADLRRRLQEARGALDALESSLS